jgi:hypothetical protein
VCNSRKKTPNFYTPGAAVGQCYHEIACQTCCVLFQAQLPTVTQTHLHERQMEERTSEMTFSSTCDLKDYI